ncbi:hypothetical protein [Piscinibacter sakaiensis]|uniref:hypothetical protein n=1 Tax=Piscinibacter sakaiensis TaxID=1547922 RepID=UPI003AB0FB3C
MIDRTFMLALTFLMLLGSLIAFTADIVSPRHANQRGDVVLNLPRVVITGDVTTADRPVAARFA